MAIPALLSAAGRMAGGVARAAGGAALETGLGALKSGLRNAPSTVFRAAGGHNVPLLSKSFDAGSSFLTKMRERREEREDRQERLKNERSKASERTRAAEDRAEQAEDDNRERQEDAHEEGVRSLAQDGNSTLKIISRDIKDVKDILTNQAKGEDAHQEQGLLAKIGGIIASLTGVMAMFSSKLSGMLGGLLGRLSGRIAGGLGRVLTGGASIASKLAGRLPGASSLLTKVGSGMSGASATGAGTASVLGRTAAGAVGKTALRRVPVIGTLATLAGAGITSAAAARRFEEGDTIGGSLEAASGMVSNDPVFGLPASMGLKAIQSMRDLAATGTKMPKIAAVTPTAPIEGFVRKPSTDASLVVANILRQMYDLMSTSSKGIYTKPASDGIIATAQNWMQGGETSRYLDQPAGVAGTANSSTLNPQRLTERRSNTTHTEATGTMSPIASHEGLGALSAHYESGKRGSAAVGWDKKGGTSYGKYQIASRTGTMDEFLKFVRQRNPEVYQQLKDAGPADAGKNGQFAQVWKRLAEGGQLGNLEHDFIKSTHYDVSMRGIKNQNLRSQIEGSKALQDVLWSTSVQHGGSGAASIFNGVYRDGMSEEELIKAIYAKRGTQFGGSEPHIRASVQNRFVDEQKRALAMVGQTNAIGRNLRESTATVASKPTIVVVPQTAPAPQTKTPAQGAQGQVVATRPGATRDPSSPIRNMNNGLMRNSVS